MGAPDRPLLLPDGVVFTCQHSGACCRGDWLIGVDDASHARLRDIDWTLHDPALPKTDAFVPLPSPRPSGERVTLARRADGACVFLAPDARCAIHRHRGAAAKPQVCRAFPYHFVETPDGIAVGVSFACTAVRAHEGARLPAQADEIRAVVAGSTRVERLPEPLTLFGTVDLDWAAYRPIEAALLRLLGQGGHPLPVGFVAGSALLSLCIGLTQLEAPAQRDGRPPTVTLAGGLAELAADDYRKLLEIAAGARYPRRPTLTYLALYTWLEMSRRRLSRLPLLLSLYGNYVRFRRARGRLPDVITGGTPFELAEAGRALRYSQSRGRGLPARILEPRRVPQDTHANARHLPRVPDVAGPVLLHEAGRARACAAGRSVGDHDWRRQGRFTSWSGRSCCTRDTRTSFVSPPRLRFSPIGSTSGRASPEPRRWSAFRPRRFLTRGGAIPYAREVSIFAAVSRGERWPSSTRSSS